MPSFWFAGTDCANVSVTLAGPDPVAAAGPPVAGGQVVVRVRGGGVVQRVGAARGLARRGRTAVRGGQNQAAGADRPAAARVGAGDPAQGRDGAGRLAGPGGAAVRG